jgi:hypothetical protein
MQRETERQSSSARADKKPWETPKLSYVGEVEDVVQQGDGKLTTVAADPGEHKKTKPSG